MASLNLVVIDAINALAAILKPFAQVAMLGFLRSNFVVVDFKTDQLSNVEELTARAKKYGAQGSAYCDAVAGTFPDEEMPPRFELWFLTHNAVVSLSY